MRGLGKLIFLLETKVGSLDKDSSVKELLKVAKEVRALKSYQMELEKRGELEGDKPRLNMTKKEAQDVADWIVKGLVEGHISQEERIERCAGEEGEESE